MTKSLNAQNIFLNKLRSDKTKVNIFTVSGIKLYGVIKGFDEFTIVLEGDDKKQTLIYKSNIVSVTPQLPVRPIRDGE